MFVSPPPTTTPQFLPGLLSKKKSDDLHTIQESPMSSQEGLHALPTGRKEFVNAPPEYANRARDEIKKRLLQKRPVRRSEASSGMASLHSFRSQPYGIDSSSEVSSLMTGVSGSTAGQSSIFSAPSFNTLATEVSSIKENHEKQIVLELEQALPSMFYDMYSPEILMNPQNLMGNGRPKFTKRELIDWDLNDIRSLLIIDHMKPEWNGMLPIIDSRPLQSTTDPEPAVPQFRFQLLPLDSPDDVIISTLVSSDLYLEANLDYEFKLTSAQYTVNSARKRHEELIGRQEPIMHLTKPEWRNIIENYLLNIAVEAQCRFDFKKACSDYKKWKLEQLQAQIIQQNEQQLNSITKPSMPPPSTIPKKSKNSLLRRALLRNSQLKMEEQLEQEQQHLQQQKTTYEPISIPTKVSLNKDEKSMVWSHCQLQVYQRLGLDWTPDNLATSSSEAH